MTGSPSLCFLKVITAETVEFGHLVMKNFGTRTDSSEFYMLLHN